MQFLQCISSEVRNLSKTYSTHRKLVEALNSRLNYNTKRTRQDLTHKVTPDTSYKKK